jgi:hypothetical protein
VEKQMNEFAVEMQDVVKQFITPEGGILAAVNHVTMQIKDGEFFSLLGPLGLRQDDFPAHDRRVRTADHGKISSMAGI